MESLDDSKATAHDFETINEYKSKPTAIFNLKGFGKKEDSPLQDLQSPSPISSEFHQNLTDSFIEYWWRGILACVVMLSSLMAIILMLGLYQNKPLPTWPFKITLNAMVSTMVVILKSSMLAIITIGLNQTKWKWFDKPQPMSSYTAYDKAINGPADALILLWTLRGKQILASTGLLVTVIAVAMGPFTQQVIQFYEFTAPSNVTGNVTLPRTSQYSISGPQIGDGEYAIDHNMLGAILGGFWSLSNVSTVVPVGNCTTGNCTFTEPYNSIGMCSLCTDLSKNVSGTCDSNGNCNYTLPSNTLLSIASSEKGGLVGAESTKASISDELEVGITFGDREFIWTNISQGVPNLKCQNGACPVLAAGCYLYPCLSTYTANVSNGVLTENLTESVPMPSVDGDDCATCLRKDCLTSTDWAVLSKSTNNITNNSYPGLDYIPYCNSADDTTEITAACVYDFGSLSQLSFSNFFSNNFSDTSTFLKGAVSGGNLSTAIGPSDLYYLYNSGFLTYSEIFAVYDNIAYAMSIQMRISMDDLGSYSLPTQGQAYYTQTLIRVEWQWLALPFTLVILTLIFLGTLMISTSINGRKPFGDAFLLALLYAAITGHRESDQLPDLRPAGFWHHLLRFFGLGKGQTYQQQENGRETVDEVKIQMQKIDDGSWRLVKI